MVRVFSEFDWHHISLVVDETEFANVLVRQSFEKIFKDQKNSNKINYTVKLDVQAYSRRDFSGKIVSNKTIDFRKILQASSRSARGNFTLQSPLAKLTHFLGSNSLDCSWK